MSRNLVISSTCFPHKAIHKGMWRSPDGNTYNQIDHALIDRRNASSIIDVRTCRGANGDSDHYLVKAVYRCRIMAWKDGHISKEPKINIQKQGNPEIREAYQKLLGEKLTQQEPEDDIDKERERSSGGSNNSTTLAFRLSLPSSLSVSVVAFVFSSGAASSSDTLAFSSSICLSKAATQASSRCFSSVAQSLLQSLLSTVSLAGPRGHPLQK
jgi:hypothetical protein